MKQNLRAPEIAALSCAHRLLLLPLFLLPAAAHSSPLYAAFAYSCRLPNKRHARICSHAWVTVPPPPPSAIGDLVRSLSEIEEDDVRRIRLTESIGALAPVPPHVEEEFQAHLAAMGTELQQEAARKAVLSADLEDGTAVAAEGNAGGDGGGKTAEATRLWALVDMMVQSKMVFKSLREGNGVGGCATTGDGSGPLEEAK